ncbi:MAG TPA: EAL domain-containing protein [Usitatibacter sp.]|jgi:diguanylate cyclase (GGDEF)-like protein|nr:EAL domain-containing protein [Usitatibacter sp.]
MERDAAAGSSRRLGMASLGTRLVLFFVALLVLVQGVGMILVYRSTGEVARQATDQALEQGERVFMRLLEQDRRRLEQAAALLSADFAFRQAIGTHDSGTIESVLRNHGARAGADLMTLAGLDGVVLADTMEVSRVGHPFRFPALLEAARDAGKASSMAMMDGHLYQVVVVPVMAPDPIAYVSAAFEVNDALARAFAQLTGLSVSFVAVGSGTWRVQATTLAPEVRDELAGALAGVAGSAGVRELSMGGEAYETRLAFLKTQGPLRLAAVLQRPVAEALAPFRRITATFLALTLAGLLLLVAGSLVIARGITRPVERLAEAAARVQQGDYRRHVDVERRDEIGQLATSFNHMLDGIVSREAQILQLAYEDPLTRLPNRARFQEHLAQAVALARDARGRVAVLLFDMDRFKGINDTLGHPVGDQVLREVANRVKGALAGGEVLARLGGDEFAVLVSSRGDERAAHSAASRIHEVLEAPVAIEGQVIDIAASIGVALFPGHAEDPASLLRAADVAMYVAKRAKSGTSVYDPRADERRREHLSLLGELRRAVEAGELVLHYQPKIALEDGRVDGVEALVRWRHPVRGFVPPSEFIPFAEQAGYIGHITRWVIDEVVAQCGRWQRAGLRLRASANISAHDLRHGDLVGHVRACLEREGLAAGMLRLEITESALMDDPRSAQSALARLRDLGVTTSIDDYGTGYSSLAYIKQLAVNELKIDRAFVSGMEADQRNAAIVRSTIELGHNLGLTVVAEGVETDHELAQLRRFGCDLAQGYHFARPMDATDFESWIARAGPAVARGVAD